jgi:CheY-like chemotaxis protein
MELTNAHVLTLDDDQDLRILVRKLLEGAGMRVGEARDVEEAFKMAQNRAPHVIISDLNMPGQSGFAFIERCRRTEWLRNVPILVLSSNNDKASIYRAISLGASDYLLKPFHSAGLTQKLRKILKNREMQRHEFIPSQMPVVTVATSCTITEAGEAGYRIEAPVRLGPEVSLRIKSPLLDELGVSEFPIQSSARAPQLRQQGQYLSEVASVGLSESALQKIRVFTRKW